MSGLCRYWPRRAHCRRLLRKPYRHNHSPSEGTAGEPTRGSVVEPRAGTRRQTAPTACFESAKEGSPSFVAAQDYADVFHGSAPCDGDVRKVIGIIPISAYCCLCRYRHKQHLLRRCEHLLEDHPHCGWAAQVRDTLQAGLALRDRRDAGGLSAHGLATARGRLLARLSRLIDNPPPHDDAERFAAHLASEFGAIFTFLWDPSVDATNWRAEQAIRPAVVIRKVCGGNRTRKGADTQQVLASVVRTARQRNLDLPALFATMLRAPDSIVPDGFNLPPPTA